jgi:UDP-GlcNAc:undecaprenyl-phosphate GlcNAc-1-phosphate transferase
MSVTGEQGPAGLFSQFIADPWLWGKIVPFGCALLSASVLSGLLVKLAPRKGWVVQPRPDRWNKRVVAQFGGVPVLAAFTAATFFLSSTEQNLVLLLATLGLGLIGLADDIFALSPKMKLLGQVLLAAVVVRAGILQQVSGVIWVDVLWTVTWIVGITNSLNLLDNMDGLAGGIAVISLAQIILFSGSTGPVTGLALCMMAAVLGFLFFNVHPARVFMGDSGALALGFFLACASVSAVAHASQPGTPLIIPVLLLFLPVFDTLLVIVTRRMHGKAVSRGARDHSSHRLVFLGLSERGAVGLLYTLAAAAGTVALLWKVLRPEVGVAVLSVLLVVSSLFWVYLAKLQLPESWLSDSKVTPVQIPASLRAAARPFIAGFLNAALIVLGMYIAYLGRFGRIDRASFKRLVLAWMLALVVKMPLLTLFTFQSTNQKVRSGKDGYAILKGISVAAIVMAGVSLLFAKAIIDPMIILLDALFTSCLMLLVASSSRLLDAALSRPTSTLTGPLALQQPDTHEVFDIASARFDSAEVRMTAQEEDRTLRR